MIREGVYVQNIVRGVLSKATLHPVAMDVAVESCGAECFVWKSVQAGG